MKGQNGEQYDLSTLLTGFIFSSYSDGTDPTEYWFGSTEVEDPQSNRVKDRFLYLVI